MIAFFVASGVNQYLNPQPPTLKELEPLLRTAKEEPGPLKPLRVETFERSLADLNATRADSRLIDLIAVTRFDVGGELSADELRKLSDRPLGISRSLFQRIYQERKEPLKLTKTEDEELGKALQWSQVLRSDAAIATPPIPAKAEANPSREIPLVTRASVLAFLLISWAIGRYYINGWRLKAANPGLPLPLAWCPENAAEAESVALRVILFPFSVALALAVPGPPELSLALALAAVVMVCGVSIRGYRIPWTRLFARGDRNPLTWGIGTYIGAFPILVVSFILAMLLTAVLPAGSHATTDALAMDPKTLTSAFVSAVVIAPLYEEVLFRGIMMPLFTQVFGRIRYGIIASSAVFAMIHMQGPPGWPVLFALGALCSFAYLHTRSIWAAIILHAAHNAAILFFTLSVSQ